MEHQISSESNLISPFLLVSATGIGVFMSALDSSIVNISLFSIASFFGVNQIAVQWVVLSYLLTITAVMTIAGNLGDKFGTKRVFQTGMGLFVVGSVLCSISPQIEFLVISRAIQALGATGVMANGIAIVTRFTDRNTRGTAIGYNSLVVAAAITTGPMLGGFLTEFLGWQSIFWINIPIGLVGILYVQKVIPPTPPTNLNKSIDKVGAFFFSLAITTFVVSLTLLENETIPSPVLVAISGVVVSFAAFIAFLRWEDNHDNPIVHLDLLRNRTFLFGVLSAVIAYGILYVFLFQLPFFLQVVMELTPSETGVWMLGIPAMMALVGPISGRLSDSYDPKYISTFGLVSIGVVTLIFSFLVSDSMPLVLVGAVGLSFGFSIGMFTSPNSNSIMSSVPKKYLGVAGGLVGLARNVGFSLGIAYSTTTLAVFQGIFMDLNGGELVDAINYVPAFRLLLGTTTLVSLVAILLSYFRGGQYQSYKKEKRSPSAN